MSLPSMSTATPPTAPPLTGRRIAFTTPPIYSARFSRLLETRGAAAFPIPSITADPSPENLSPYLLPSALDPFSALALPSRTAISAFFTAYDSVNPSSPPPLSSNGAHFTIAALGSDAELIRDLNLLDKLDPTRKRIQLLVPKIATPAALAAALGEGNRRRVLCPVPDVIGLEEPPVVPDFLKELEAHEWVAVRVPAYVTKWAGPKCMETLVNFEGVLDGLVFTSTAEVEGMLKGLESLGWDWKKVKERWPEIVVAAHGPVTAKGAERWGVVVDVVGMKFSSFDGVLDALASWYSET